jgi:hypothetical protein
MQDSTVYYPEKRSGLVFQGGLALFLLALSGLGFLVASQQETGVYFVLWMVVSLIFIPPAALLIYRAYTLTQAAYVMEREGLRLRWGLRAEDISLRWIEWIRPANEMGFELRLPFLRWQGALVGIQVTEGLGEVEFMASDLDNLLLVATPQKVYAISPQDSKGFLRQFQLINEMGSLTDLPLYSTRSTAFMQAIWADGRARFLMLSGISLTFLLFVFTSVFIPTRANVSMGFDNKGQLMQPGPPETLLLFPVLAGLALGVDLVAGFYFYRREDSPMLAYFTWASSCIIPILLLIVMVKLL